MKKRLNNVLWFIFDLVVDLLPIWLYFLMYFSSDIDRVDIVQFINTNFDMSTSFIFDSLRYMFDELLGLGLPLVVYNLIVYYICVEILELVVHVLLFIPNWCRRLLCRD